MSAMQSFMDYLGLAERLRQAKEAEQQGQWNGIRYGDIPVLGGALHPLATTANAVGLGLEGAGTAAKAIAGIAAIPAVYAQTKGSRDNPLTAYSQQIADRGLGDLLIHPGRTIGALRQSPDRATSYLAGILEMASDPTNVLLTPASGYLNAGRTAAAAERAGARATVSEEFFAGKAREMARADEAIQTIDNFITQEGLSNAAKVGEAGKRLSYYDSLLSKESERTAALDQSRQRIGGLSDQLATAKDKTEAARFSLNEHKDYYKEARNAVAADLKAKREMGYFDPVPKPLRDEAGNLFDNPAAYAVKQANEQKRIGVVNEVLARYPGGPQQGMTYRDFLAEPKQALGQALYEEKKIAELYQQAIKEAPDPIRYSNTGVPLGKDKDLMRRVEANTEQNAMDALQQADPNTPIGKVLTGYEMPVPEGAVAAPKPPTGVGYEMDADAARKRLGMEPLDSPKAIASGLDRLGQAANQPPPPGVMGPNDIRIADTRGFGTRMYDLLSHALREGITEQRAAMARPGATVNFSQLAGIWKGIATQTLRNVFMDEAYSRIMLLDAGVRNEAYTRARDQAIQRRRAGEGGAPGFENPLMQLGPVSDVLSAIGYGKKMKPKEAKEIFDKIGVDPFEAETDNIRQLSAMQHLFGSSLIGLSNPVRASVGVVGLPLGYLGPMRQRMFHIINNVTHMAAKGEAFSQGFLPYLDNSAKRLLQLAEAEGKDTTYLRGFGMFDPQTGERILEEGAFSKEQVRQFLGQRYADEWQRMTDQAVEAGYARATEVFGNYAQRGPLERQLDKFFPFMSWTWRNYGRVSKALLAHPAVAAGAIQLLQAEIEDAKANNRPAYLATTVGFDKDTPLIGVLARVFSPEQEASVRLNPLALINPFSSTLLAGESTGENADQTPYQRAEQLIGLTGATPNPLIQGAAYVTGQDYQSPSPLSRYNAVDQMWNDLGINAEAPSLLHGTLRAAREKVTGEKDTYDPVLAKAKELIYEDTGFPVSDPRNAMVAAQLEAGIDPHGYLKRAERIVDVGGAGRAVFNATSPISASVVSNTTEERRNAGKPPWTYDQIQQAKQAGLVGLARRFESENENWYLTHGAGAVNRNAQVRPGDVVIARGAEKRRLLAQQMGVR